MEHSGQKLMPLTEQEILTMLDETSQLVAAHSSTQLSSAALVAHSSSALTDSVEFWKWMARNYHQSGIFDSPATIQAYLSQGPGKADWLAKQLQGKGYEWDWMTAQRTRLSNIFKTYDAGDIANRVASDVTEHNILTGQSTEYQMKAYIHKSNPDLKTTPKDMTVVTNSEKTAVIRKNGYTSVEAFQDADAIKSATDKRMEQAGSGKAQTSYNIRNVTATMAQAGLVGCVIGVGAEAIASYRAWKEGRLTDQEYFQEIMKSGGDAGVTSGATAGIMIPVSAVVTVTGVSSLVTIPIAFAVSAAVNKVVASCFGRGDYRKILSEDQYYCSIEAAYDDLLSSMQIASEEYYGFVCQIAQQIHTHQAIKETDIAMDSKLKNLLDSI